ncbi:hypothetical protein B0H16DRAFT_1737734 [Mycena metata]|uniref:Uncharacterized protein n=1 Tax=Mycena metata TaxID=1033252 RepID=A0AAD7ML58_9AGAR|nr:hypothetical protein B0H16DRAFT_1737734 [Mycena metata]
MSFTVLTLPKLSDRFSPLRNLDIEPAQRKGYLKHPNTDFWDKLDLKLQDIREKAGGESKKVVKAFCSILEADQAKHGQKTYKGSDMEDKTNEFQQMVDNIIDISAMDAATSTQDQPGGT